MSEALERVQTQNERLAKLAEDLRGEMEVARSLQEALNEEAFGIINAVDWEDDTNPAHKQWAHLNTQTCSRAWLAISIQLLLVNLGSVAEVQS